MIAFAILETFPLDVWIVAGILTVGAPLQALLFNRGSLFWFEAEEESAGEDAGEGGEE